MKREQFLTLILTIFIVIAAYFVLKPRIVQQNHTQGGFGSNARPVYVEGKQKAPAHSAKDSVKHKTHSHAEGFKKKNRPESLDNSDVVIVKEDITVYEDEETGDIIVEDDVNLEPAPKTMLQKAEESLDNAAEDTSKAAKDMMKDTSEATEDMMEDTSEFIDEKVDAIRSEPAKKN